MESSSEQVNTSLKVLVALLVFLGILQLAFAMM